MLGEGRRPTGVTVVAVLVALGGVGPLAFGIVSLIGSAATLLSTADSPALPIAVMGAIYLGIAAVYFFVAWALADLRSWAWVLAVVVSGGQVLVNVLAALGGNVGWPQAIGGSLIPLIVFVYLFRVNVRSAFGR
jgi:hypothetical protein